MSLSEDQLQTISHLVTHMQEVLPRQLDTLTESIQTLQTRVAHLEGQQQQLFNLLQQQPTSPSSVPNGVKIRLPTQFAGKASLCTTYFSQLALYFAGNPAHDTDEKKILLAISCLTGPPYNYMEPFLTKLNSKDKPEILRDYDLFVDTITSAFGDSDATVSAETALRNLKQTTSASAYVTEFRRLSSLVQWNEAALISQFNLNLKDHLENELARERKGRTLEQLLFDAVEIDNKLFQRQRNRRLAAPPSAPRRPEPTSSAMDIDTPASTTRHVSNDERNRRSQENACYYCGQQGHMTKNCPAKKPKSHHHVSTVILAPEDKAKESWYHVHALSYPGGSVNQHASFKVIKDDFKDFQAELEYKDSTLIHIPVIIGVPMPGAKKSPLTHALLDTGATTNIISFKLAMDLGFPIDFDDRTEKYIYFCVADGSRVKSYGVYNTKMRIAGTIHHSEVITFHIMDNASHDVILGMPWLKTHHLHLKPGLSTGTMQCDTSVCCAGDFNRELYVKVRTPTVVTPPVSPEQDELSEEDLTFAKNRQKGYPKTYYPHDIQPPVEYDPTSPTAFPSMNKDIISALYLPRLFNTFEKLNSFYSPGALHQVASIATPSSSQEESPTIPEVPVKYQEYSKVFSKIEAAKLPPHRKYDHKIPLKEGTTVPYGPMYSMSKLELETLHEYIQENLAKGFIRRSESPAGSPVLFVKKKDGSLRLCIDYRGLNKITIASPAVLPLISETLDRLNQAKIFSKLDMIGAYNLNRVAPGDEWKTAFICRYGHFEYNVMSFGLCSAPATFQAFVNDVLRDYLDQFIVVYLDDILIFSDTQEDHDNHVRLVLQKLQDAQLSLKIEKCEFDVTTVNFLGFIVSTDGISMDQEKIKSIKDWTPCRSVHDIQVFLGLTNFYRRFIKDYSKICNPLTLLLKKDVKFQWSPQANDSFNALKLAITSDPILKHLRRIPTMYHRNRCIRLCSRRRM